MTALRHTVPDSSAHEDLDTVVARIRASGQGAILPLPSDDAIARLVARVQTETPLSQGEQDAWNQAWGGILADIHTRDRVDDIAEGRG